MLSDVRPRVLLVGSGTAAERLKAALLAAGADAVRVEAAGAALRDMDDVAPHVIVVISRARVAAPALMLRAVLDDPRHRSTPMILVGGGGLLAGLNVRQGVVRALPSDAPTHAVVDTVRAVLTGV